MFGMEEEEEEDLPEIVGLSKLQFFVFLLSAIILGAGCLGIGYFLAVKNKSTSVVQKQNAANNPSGGGALNKNFAVMAFNSSVNNYLNVDSDSGQGIIQTNQNGQMIEGNQNPTTHPKTLRERCYIVMGKFRSEDLAKQLCEKLKEIGKTGLIKMYNSNYLVYIGPFPESVAQNEIESIGLLTNTLSGSIVEELP